MFLIALLACTPTDTATTKDFEGGNFQFTTTGVTDSCNDGAFETIFMPDGEATDFETPIELPSTVDLPSTYNIDLQDPFTEMEVTVEAGDRSDHMLVNGAEQTGVEWDQANSPGCLVDASIDIDLAIVNPNKVQGYALLHTGSFDEENCPVVTSDPCDVRLDVSAERI